MQSQEPFFKNRSFLQTRKGRVLSFLILLVILITAFFLFTSFGKIWNGSQNSQGEPVEVKPFKQPLVLSLGSTVKDKEGIPYSGVVEYNPVSETYSYIASADEGPIVPLGPSAFSNISYYLAVQDNDQSSNLVIYDRENYQIERIVENYPVGFVVWSPGGDRFAYKSATSVIKVAGVDTQMETKTLDFGFPVGFSLDGSKLLTSGGPVLAIADIETGEYTSTTGAAFLGTGLKYLLSPDSTTLIAISEKEVSLYRVDWESKNIQLIEVIPSSTRILDAVFTDSNTFLVRDAESKLLRLFTLVGETVDKSFAEVTLPEDAHIFQVIKP